MSGIKKTKVKLTKGELTRESILLVAEEQFSLNGYKATNLRQIARLADIQVQGLYNYFDSKESLYIEVLERAFNPIKQALEAALKGDTGGAAVTLPGTMTMLLAERPHVMKLFQHAVLGEDDIGSQITKRWFDLFFKQGLSILKRQERNVSRREMSLKMLAIYNIVTSYFLSEKIFSRFKSGSIMDSKNLDIQKEIVENLVGVLFDE